MTNNCQIESHKTNLKYVKRHLLLDWKMKTLQKSIEKSTRKTKKKRASANSKSLRRWHRARCQRLLIVLLLEIANLWQRANSNKTIPKQANLTQRGTNTKISIARRKNSEIWWRYNKSIPNFLKNFREMGL